MAGPIGNNRPNRFVFTVGDVAAAYDSLGQNIEAMYAKLIAEVKGSKEAIEDQIKQIDRQIVSIKDQILKLEKMLQAIGTIMPLLTDCVNQDEQITDAQQGAAEEARRNALAQQLTAIVQELGIKIDDPANVEETMRKLVDGMGAGGNGAMAIAFFIMSAVCEAAGDAAVADTHAAAGFDSEAFLARLDEIGDKAAYADAQDLINTGLTLSANDFEIACMLSQLPFGQGEVAGLQFLATRFADQITSKIESLNTQIDALQDTKKALQAYIKVLDKQIAHLEKQKAQALVEQKKQKQKALKDV